MSHRSVERELDRLVAAGVVKRGVAGRVTVRRTSGSESYKRPYSADPACPIYLELRRIALLSRGAASTIRSALPEHARLAWITGPYALGRARPQDPIEVAVIASAAKRTIETVIAGLDEMLRRPVRPIVIFKSEWVARHDKRELTVRRLRSGPKLWLRGDRDALRAMEAGVRESRELLRQALANADDLTDEWDEDWDPFDPIYRG